LQCPNGRAGAEPVEPAAPKRTFANHSKFMGSRSNAWPTAEARARGENGANAQMVCPSCHKVSAKYLPLYVAEFQFRYNNRFNDDIFATAIEGV